MAELIDQAEEENRPVGEVAHQLAFRDAIEATPVIPLHPREVWGCGCTYRSSSEFRDGELGHEDGMYAYVHDPGHRPELFFKGTARVCVGPGEPIGIRKDSTFTAPEPEFAVVVNSKAKIVGYTLSNDVSAWDIERENALYLPQSKQFDACCSLGPTILTTDSIEDVYNLEMTMTITRGTTVLFEGKASTGQLKRKLEELVEYLFRSNTVPGATLLQTGTGIIVKEDAKLEPGDVCSITIPQMGTLSNPAAYV
jgi:2-dehydro-3-deoxy-D-arabinonate dehydratase